jgi:hypothetical protein
MREHVRQRRHRAYPALTNAFSIGWNHDPQIDDFRRRFIESRLR